MDFLMESSFQIFVLLNKTLLPVDLTFLRNFKCKRDKFFNGNYYGGLSEISRNVSNEELGGRQDSKSLNRKCVIDLTLEIWIRHLKQTQIFLIKSLFRKKSFEVKFLCFLIRTCVRNFFWLQKTWKIIPKSLYETNFWSFSRSFLIKELVSVVQLF